jgi:hypothetical protein
MGGNEFLWEFNFETNALEKVGELKAGKIYTPSK